MDYESVFDELEKSLAAIDYEPEHRDSFEVETEDGSEQGHFIFTEVENGPDFAIIANESDQFCRIQSQYHLWEEVARQTTTEQIEDLVDPDTIEEIPEDHPAREFPVTFEDLDKDQVRELLAAATILTNVGQEARQETIHQLTEKFTAAEVKHRVDSLGDYEGLSGFMVYHKVFPQEDDFSLSTLNDAVERVRMATHRGEIFLRYVFGLSVDIDGQAQGPIENKFESPPED